MFAINNIGLGISNFVTSSVMKKPTITMSKITFQVLASSYLFLVSNFLLADAITPFGCPQLYGITAPEADTLRGPIEYIDDIDGDGFTDFAVGADKDLENLISAGNIRVYSGKTGKRIYTIYSPAGLGSAFGEFIVRSEDLNGDGIADLLVAVSDSGGYPTTTPGKILIYSGKDGALIRTINGPALNEGFGETSLASVDITGDGKPEIFVGAGKVRDPDDVTSHIGRIYIYSGSTFNLINTWDSVGSDYHLFPGPLIPIGDLNGDGVPELVGAKWVAGGGFSGLFRVFSGQTGEVLIEVNGSYNMGLGGSLADLGDLNGDNISDLGVITYPMSGAQNLFIFSGADLAINEIELIADLDLSFDEDNRNVSCDFGGQQAYDVDGDGFKDFLLGCRSRTTNHLHSLNGQIMLISGDDFSTLYSDSGRGAYAALGFRSTLVPNFGRDDYFGIVASRNNELSDERGSVRVYGLSHDNNNNSIPDVCEAVNGNGGGNGGGGQPGGGSGGNTDNPNDDIKAKSEAWIKVVNTRLKTALAGSNLLLKRLIPKEKLQKIRELKGEEVFKKRRKLRNSIARARRIFKEEIEAIFKEKPKTVTSAAYSIDGALRAAVKEYNRGITTARWKKAKPIVKEALRQFGEVLGRS